MNKYANKPETILKHVQNIQHLFCFNFLSYIRVLEISRFSLVSVLFQLCGQTNAEMGLIGSFSN